MSLIATTSKVLSGRDQSARRKQRPMRPNPLIAMRVAILFRSLPVLGWFSIDSRFEDRCMANVAGMVNRSLKVTHDCFPPTDQRARADLRSGNAGARRAEGR